MLEVSSEYKCERGGGNLVTMVLADFPSAYMQFHLVYIERLSPDEVFSDLRWLDAKKLMLTSGTV